MGEDTRRPFRPSTMKTPLLLLAPLFSLTMLLASARAAEPVPPQLPPELQALLADLLKQMQAEAEVDPSPAPQAAAVPAAPTAPAKPPLGSASSLRTGGLSTSGLVGASLAPAGSVGGRGQMGAPRLSKEEWRVIFPIQQERR